MAIAVAGRRRSLPAVSATALIAWLTALGAAVRFGTLGVQSYWYDETTTVRLVRLGFGKMLAGVHNHETTPPLYFALAWIWTRLFGDSEVGLRSLSAVCGTLMIPVSYAAARALVGRRTGVVVAVLAALSPALVWYSQEARSYALLTLLCALSLLFFARTLARPAPASFAGWAVTSSLALTAHYFALFLVVPEAVWLVTRGGRRRLALLACAPIAAAAAALAPLALYQRAHGGGGWIGATGFGDRLRHVPYFFAVGLAGQQAQRAVLLATALVFAIALFFLCTRLDATARSGALIALALGVATLAIPLAGSVVGSDYVLDRNLLPAWLPLTVVVAAGFGAVRAGRVGPTLIAAVCAVFVATDVLVATDPQYQRDPWRTVARTLGRAAGDRVIAVAPAWQAQTLPIYLPSLERVRSTVHVSEVDTLDYRGFVPVGRAATAGPGAPFSRAGDRTVEWIAVARFRAPRPVAIAPGSLSQFGDVELFLQRAAG